jgi:hypothetical protein
MKKPTKTPDQLYTIEELEAFTKRADDAGRLARELLPIRKKQAERQEKPLRVEQPPRQPKHPQMRRPSRLRE